MNKEGSGSCLLNHEQALEQAKECHTTNSGRPLPAVIKPNAFASPKKPKLGS